MGGFSAFFSYILLLLNYHLGVLGLLFDDSQRVMQVSTLPRFCPPLKDDLPVNFHKLEQHAAV